MAEETRHQAMTARASHVEEIERLAGGATAGPWQQSHRKNEFDGQYRTQVYDATGEAICTVSWYPIHYEGGTKTAREDNAAYIAAANPAAVLALIAELRAALAARDEALGKFLDQRDKLFDCDMERAEYREALMKIESADYVNRQAQILRGMAREALAGSEGKVKTDGS